MAKTIRVGVVGCGKIAQVSHARRYAQLKGVQIASLFDVDPTKVEALRRLCAPDAQAFDDFDAFLASGLDAVSICSPNHLHFAQAMAAFKAGLHVLCEKPMAASLADATRMINAARSAGKVLQINQSLRYSPLYVTLADLVAKRRIGTPTHIRCIRSGPTTPDKGWSPGAKWFVSKEANGGLILDIGVHMADLMQWCVGEVEEIAAYVDTRTTGIDVPDNVSALMRFANGATGVLELSWTMPCGGATLEIYGTKGTLRQGFSNERSIELITPDFGKGRRGRKVVAPPMKKRVKDSFAAFIDAVRGKAPSPTPGELGRDALALCDAIARSGATGRFVKVKRYP